MLNTTFDSSHHHDISLGEKIGHGGEGEVYIVEGMQGMAAKIYRKELRKQREAKIRVMIEKKFSTSVKEAAFPIQLLNVNREFAGFMMPLASDHLPIHELYNPKSRRIHFKSADFRFLVRTALNLAIAVRNIHRTGCVIGDINQSGILVSQSATVILIDTDSFQFEYGTGYFLSEVGVVDYTPPELQGVKLDSVVRTKLHDFFGLAIAIFQLLFMGRHPYSGTNPNSDLGIGEAIAQNQFSFTRDRIDTVEAKPPPNFLKLKDMPTPIANAMERAFGLNPKRRPSAQEWISILKGLEQSLKKCSTSEAHYYSRSSQFCIWCKLSKISGTDLFSEAMPKISFDLKIVENEIQKISKILNSNYVCSEIGILSHAQIKSNVSDIDENLKLLKPLFLWGYVFGVVAVLAYLDDSDVSGLVRVLFIVSFLGGLYPVIRFPELIKRNKLRKLKLANARVQSFLDSHFAESRLNQIRKFKEGQDVLIGMVQKYRNLCEQKRSTQKQKSNLESKIMNTLYMQQMYCKKVDKLILALKNQKVLKSLVRYRNDCAKQLICWTKEQIPDPEIHINL